MGLLLVLLLFFMRMICSAEKQNILLILTDDQDASSTNSLKKTQKLIADSGATFLNSFCSTPVCCPSRASILTGQYQHNHRTLNNSISGGCFNSFWKQSKEPLAFPVYLQSAGYRTFYAGKYLNQYGSARKVKNHVPRGWNFWAGLIGNSKYYNYSLVINGTTKYFENDYFTSVIESYGMDFLQSAHSSNENFLMVLATSACHDPFTPDPKHAGKFNGTGAPRPPNFNIPISKDKHWLLRLGDSPLPSFVIDKIDEIHARRLETLLSVDDMVENFVLELGKLNLLDNTVIIYTSDNGYHLGQFSLPWDKRQAYEFDIRVPLFIRGPNIEPKLLISSPVVNIDLAPTILDLANVPIPDSMDGVSFVPLLKNTNKTVEPRGFLVEYHGEGALKSVDTECLTERDSSLKDCHVKSDCKCQDAKNNTYACLRFLSDSSDISYCKYEDTEDFVEYYDLKTDSYQLNNLAHVLPTSLHDKYLGAIKFLQKCIGPICNSLVL